MQYLLSDVVLEDRFDETGRFAAKFRRIMHLYKCFRCSFGKHQPEKLYIIAVIAAVLVDNKRHIIKIKIIISAGLKFFIGNIGGQIWRMASQPQQLSLKP